MDKAVFDRLITEFNENNERADKLRNFILNNEKFNEIDNLNKDLMVAQLKAMEAYLSVLSIRIGLNASQEDIISESAVDSSL